MVLLVYVSIFLSSQSNKHVLTISPAYKMETPDDGWSFRDGVGKSLPSTFFSYGQTTSDKLAAKPTGALFGSSLSGAKRDHRFAAISERRQVATDLQARGYSDGVATAKIFGMHNGSKLGFIDQYIDDSIKVLGALVPVGSAGSYRSGFMRGLREMEAVLRTT
jgi:glucan 1,3-beta-glucosidase